ncbi:hypothetical protein IF2G_01226 [Cordyceps javanica]|nr:hypothetical protein IF2G_01226 [Cordyceps javanica]
MPRIFIHGYTYDVPTKSYQQVRLCENRCGEASLAQPLQSRCRVWCALTMFRFVPTKYPHKVRLSLSQSYDSIGTQYFVKWPTGGAASAQRPNHECKTIRKTDLRRGWTTVTNMSHSQPSPR